jgi:hypothetical protein
MVFCFIGSSTSPAKSPQDNNPTTFTLQKLEQQYESSRYLTHMARGVGLGFNSAPESSGD